MSQGEQWDCCPGNIGVIRTCGEELLQNENAFPTCTLRPSSWVVLDRIQQESWEVFGQLKSDGVDLSRAFAIHSRRNNDTLTISFLTRLKAPGFQDIYDADADSTISCHCGPNTLSIVFMRQ